VQLSSEDPPFHLGAHEQEWCKKAGVSLIAPSASSSKYVFHFNFLPLALLVGSLWMCRPKKDRRGVSPRSGCVHSVQRFSSDLSSSLCNFFGSRAAARAYRI
jgi:hypothetical protein